MILMLLDCGYTLCNKVLQKLLHVYQVTDAVTFTEAMKQPDTTWQSINIRMNNTLWYIQKREYSTGSISNKMVLEWKQIKKQYLQYVMLYVNFISQHKNIKIIEGYIWKCMKMVASVEEEEWSGKYRFDLCYTKESGQNVNMY